MVIENLTESRSLLSVNELRGIIPFLSEEENTALSPYLTLKEWRAGDVVMKEGEHGDFMGFLVKGVLAVKKKTSFADKHILVAILEKGSVVGEIAVVEPKLRNATVVASDNCQLLILTHANLNKLLESNHALGMKILKRIIYVLGVRLAKVSNRLASLL